MSIRIERKIVGYEVVKKEEEAAAKAKEQAETAERKKAKIIRMTEWVARPEGMEALEGSTYKIKTPLDDHAMYVTINDIILNLDTEHEQRRPFEIFINSKNMEHYAWTVALTRMISAVFRRGGDVSFVVEELKAVFDPRGGQWMEGRYVPSLLAAIGEVIERHMIEIGFLPTPKERREGLLEEKRQVIAAGGTDMPALAQCPKCAQASVIRQEGCDLCTSCGYSKCG